MLLISTLKLTIFSIYSIFKSLILFSQKRNNKKKHLKYSITSPHRQNGHTLCVIFNRNLKYFFCPHIQGPRLLPKYRVKSFLLSSHSLESPVDPHLYNAVRNRLVDLLGDRSYFASKVLTPYCYTLGKKLFFFVILCLLGQCAALLVPLLQTWR